MKNISDKIFKKRIFAGVMAVILIITGIGIQNAFADRDRIDKSSPILGTSSTLGDSTLGDSGEEVDKDPVPLGASTMMAPFAMGDVVTNLSSSTNLFRSYTEITTGAIPPEMNLSALVAVTKDNLTDVNVVVKADIKNGYLNTPYFIYKGHSQIGGDSIFDSITNNNDGTFTIKVKDGVPANSEQNVSLLFTLAPEYDGNVTPESVMASFTATTKVGAEEVGTSAQVDIKTNTLWGKRNTTTDPFVPSGPLVDGKLEIFSGQVVTFRTRNNNTDFYQNFLDMDFASVHKYYVPVGTELVYSGGNPYSLDKGDEDKGVTVAAGEIESVPAGKYYVLFIDWPRSATNPASGWNLENGIKGKGFLQTDTSIIFPDLPDKTVIPLYSVLTYKIKSDPAIKTHETVLTYKINDDPKWLFRFKGEHSTGGSSIAVTGINDGDTGGLSLKTGHGYTNSSSSGNYGNLPIKNMVFRLYQVNPNDPTTPGKVNFNNFSIDSTRESVNTEWVTVEVYAVIASTIPGVEDRVTVKETKKVTTSTSLSFDLNANANLQPGEYINEVFMTPMGVDGTERGVLPVGNSLAFSYNYKAWPGQKWPDGSKVDNYTVIPMGWDVTYLDADDITTTTLTAPITERSTVTYQRKGPLAIVQGSPISANANDAEPESKVTYRLTGYNILNYGGQGPWDDPVIILGMPAGVKLDPLEGLKMSDMNGASISEVIAKPVSTSSGRSYYRLNTAPGTSIPLKETQGQFFIDFDIKTPAGIAAGSYLIDVVLTSNPASNFYNGNTLWQNNKLPDGQTKSDYGLGTDENYSWSNFTDYQQVPFTVGESAKSSASSAVQTDRTPAWSTNRVVPADFGDEAKMKLTTRNNGNVAMKNIRLYDIIPYDGYSPGGYASSGTVSFEGIEVPPGSTIHYYHGANKTQPPLSSIQTIDVNSADWSTDPAGATAFYVDFGANTIPGGGSLDVIIKFKVPVTGPQQTVYNQFTLAFNSPNIITGAVQGFSTHFYGINFVRTTGVTNIPDDQTGGFDAAPFVNVDLTSQIPAKQYYIFDNWRETTTGDFYKAPHTFIFTMSPEFKEVMLEAVFSPDPAYAITVNYHNNGGTGAIIDPIQTHHAGDFIVAPDVSGLSKSGMMPSGKYRLTPGDTGALFDFDQPLPGAPTTLNLYVDWIINPASNFVVNFDVNGGVAASKPAPISAILGVPVGVLPGDPTGPVPPIFAGRNFKGWSTTPGGAANFTSASLVTGDITVHAVWELKSYTVTLNKNGGVGGADSISVQHGNPGGAAALPPKGGAVPTKDGFAHIGWAQSKYEADQGNADYGDVFLPILTGDKEVWSVWEVNKHTITLDPNFDNDPNGVVGTEATLTITEGATPPPLPMLPDNAPTRYGHELKGWSLTQTVADPNNPIDPVKLISSTDLGNIKANTTLYAVWATNTVTVIFERDGGAVVTPASQRFVFGRTIGTLPKTTKKGYVSNGWSTTKSASIADFKETDTFTYLSSMSVFPVWEPIKYTLTFNQNNTDTGSTPAKPDTTQVIFDAAIGTLPTGLNAPTRVGYNFVKWSYTDAEPYQDVSATDIYTKEADSSVYAVWDIITYDITLDPNSGSGGKSPLNIEYGNKSGKTLPMSGTDAPTKTGYKLLGWSETPIAPDYDPKPNPNPPVLFGSEKLKDIRADKKLYAVWKISPYTLTFDKNTTDAGSTTGTPSIGVSFENPYDYLPNAQAGDGATRIGYTLKGWGKQRDTTIANIIKTTDLYDVDGDSTVYAVWEIDTYTVTLNGNEGTGGTGSIDVVYKNVAGEKLPVKGGTGIPVRDTYTFQGWSKTKSESDQGTVDFVFTDLQNLVDDIEVFAVWTQNKYTLTFSENGATEKGASSYSIIEKNLKEVKYLPKAGEADAPKWPGYTLLGWATTSTTTTPDFTQSSIGEMRASRTVHAVWDANPYTVTLHGNGGKFGTSTTQAFPIKYGNVAGEKLPSKTLPAGAPVLDIYTFQGWAKTQAEANLGTVNFTDADLKTVMANTDVYAVWTLNTYTLTLDQNNTDAGSTTGIGSFEVIEKNATGPNHKTLPKIGESAAPTRPHYKLLGWADSVFAATAGNVNYVNADLVDLRSDKTVFAVWERILHIVTLDQQNATTNGKPTLLIEEGNNGPNVVLLPKNLDQDAPARTGYKLAGWSTNTNPTAVNFEDTDLATIIGPVRLYPVWTAETSTLTFNPNHPVEVGSTPPNPTSRITAYDSPYDPPMGDNAPSRIGYKFQGWTKTLGSTTVDVKASDLYKEIGDSTIHAVWDINKYTITFDPAGGELGAAFPVIPKVDHGKTLGADMPTVKPTRVGYDFVEWNTTINGVDTNFDGTLIMTESINVFAVWKIQNYTVTFNSGDADVPATPGTKNADFNTTLVGNMPTDPSKIGHIFKGWSTAVGSLTSDFDENTKVVGSITLHPVWEVIKYNITVEQWFYSYNQDYTQATQGSFVVTDPTAYGTSYKVKLEDFPEYNFMSAYSDKDIDKVVGDQTIKLYYQDVSFTITARAEVQLAVNDRYPLKDNSITLREFEKLADVTYASNKIPTARMASRSTGDAVVDSPDFKTLDFRTITDGYDQSVTLDFAWPSGQTDSVTLKVQMVDRVAPTIEIADLQSFNLDNSDRFPRNEAELMTELRRRGLVVSDNYDGELNPVVRYEDGSFGKMSLMTAGRNNIIYLTTKDSSGNASVEKKVTLASWQPTEDYDGTDKPDKDKYDVIKDTEQNKDGAKEITEENTGITYDKEKSIIILNGRPVMQLPKTGGGKIALATGILGVPLLIPFVLFFLAKRKKDDDESEDNE